MPHGGAIHVRTLAARINRRARRPCSTQRIRLPAKDRVVLVEQSREMAKNLSKAGIQTFRYLELPDGDHYLSRAEDRIRFFQELERFLTTHLDGNSTAPQPEHLQ